MKRTFREQAVWELKTLGLIVMYGIVGVMAFAFLCAIFGRN